jgi:hypothetical protein
MIERDTELVNKNIWGSDVRLNCAESEMSLQIRQVPTGTFVDLLSAGVCPVQSRHCCCFFRYHLHIVLFLYDKNTASLPKTASHSLFLPFCLLTTFSN